MSIWILLLHLKNEVGTAWWLIQTLQFSTAFTLCRGQVRARCVISPYRACLKQAVDLNFVLKSFSRAERHEVTHLCGTFRLQKKHSVLWFDGYKLPLGLIKTKWIFSGLHLSKCERVPGCYYAEYSCYTCTCTGQQQRQSRVQMLSIAFSVLVKEAGICAMSVLIALFNPWKRRALFHPHW